MSESSQRHRQGSPAEGTNLTTPRRMWLGVLEQHGFLIEGPPHKLTAKGNVLFRGTEQPLFFPQELLRLGPESPQDVRTSQGETALAIAVSANRNLQPWSNERTEEVTREKSPSSCRAHVAEHRHEM